MSDNWWIRPYFPDNPAPEPILRDVFDGWDAGAGIFYYLSSAATLPWSQAESVDNSVLDIAYFGNHSGGKFCSPLVKLVIDEETGIVLAPQRATIAKILVSKYLPNWERLWETNIVSYTPIHNYDMTEERATKKADSSAEVEDRNASDTTTHGRTNTEFDYKYGLNTDTDNPKPSDRIDSTEGGETSNEAESNTKRNRVGAEEEDETIHRAGNIGVTTTQKLIQEERALWIWNYFDQVFNDLDRELALLFHDSCRV